MSETPGGSAIRYGREVSHTPTSSVRFETSKIRKSCSTYPLTVRSEIPVACRVPRCEGPSQPDGEHRALPLAQPPRSGPEGGHGILTRIVRFYRGRNILRSGEIILPLNGGGIEPHLRVFVTGTHCEPIRLGRER